MPPIPEYRALTPDALDALERAVRERRRVALRRRGTEYVVVAERLDTGERERLVAAGLRAELAEREGEPDVELAELARAVDAVLVGRRGVTTKGDALGPTASSLIRIADRCVIVCGGLPSPMTACALAFDG